MQESIVAIEREAARRIPGILADLLDEPVGRFDAHMRESDDMVALIVTDDRDRRWIFEVKRSSGPGLVAAAADQLRRIADQDAIAVLVVPHMTAAGASAATEHDLNWLDLSGNAHIRGENFFLSREGRPNAFPPRGRPSSPFAPKSARVARVMLQDPQRWWRQKDLAQATGLDDGRISRIVRRLDADRLLQRDGSKLRPGDPELLLDAWADDYRFDRHDVVVGHASGSGIELARELSGRLAALHIGHALTGLPAAWLLDRFAGFRLSTIYVHGDPRDAADRLELRRNERGANVQLVAPNDPGVFADGHEIEGLPIVSPVQAYVDLRTLPERAAEAADHLRDERLLWPT
jgi:hypothetical protein